MVYGMKVACEMTQSGQSMASTDRVLAAGEEYNGNTTNPITVKEIMREMGNRSCHNKSGVKCVLCDKCQAWLITARVVCMVCSDQRPPVISRFFQGCQSEKCAANNSNFAAFCASGDHQKLLGICDHVKKTDAATAYEFFSATEHIGNIIKNGQFGLLTNATRVEIISTINKCRESNTIHYLVSFNALAYFHAFGEKEIVKCIEEYWKEKQTPDRSRSFMDFTADQLNSPYFASLCPKKSRIVLHWLSVVDPKKREELRKKTYEAPPVESDDGMEEDEAGDFEDQCSAEEEPNPPEDSQPTRRTSKRIRHETERVKGWKKQEESLKRIERERKEWQEKNNGTFSFANYCSSNDCNDFSFLLRDKLTGPQSKCLEEMYKFFGICHVTESSIQFFVLTP